MTVNIRPITANDEQQWRTLWCGYLAYYETELGEEIYQSSFARLLGDDPQDFSGFVAEEDGKLLGLVHYLFHRHGWKIENTCYLQDLYTVPEARGKGVGRSLIEAVYTEADRQNAPSVYWMTQDFNKKARILYDTVGVLSPFIKYTRP
ncbi:GNAT family N-acetyltransferase [Cochlodiniinecator piscidefendens]|uniref:GNAT family N-acetyltransferase n=1 Tax=Cochlodiniinecator piscidefendens TaxID=2715756 RepID=UPI00140C6DFB|nr:GNAT family N-acetyltransferase [Cochlodiniinecator piscidefendens]